MLQSKNFPLNLWAESVNTAVYTLNRAGQSEQGGSVTPYELLIGEKPNLSRMRIFGTVAYTHFPKQFVKKLDAALKKLILVGYQGNSLNYRLNDKETKVVSVRGDFTDATSSDTR